jgi:hypothetical protein
MEEWQIQISPVPRWSTNHLSKHRRICKQTVDGQAAVVVTIKEWGVAWLFLVPCKVAQCFDEHGWEQKAVFEWLGEQHNQHRIPFASFRKWRDLFKQEKEVEMVFRGLSEV